MNAVSNTTVFLVDSCEVGYKDKRRKDLIKIVLNATNFLTKIIKNLNDTTYLLSMNTFPNNELYRCLILSVPTVVAMPLCPDQFNNNVLPILK